MTVNELIAQLQTLSAQGHGELDVVVYEEGLDDWTTDIKADYFSPDSSDLGYKKKGIQMGLPHIYVTHEP
jgi:hypothetical protein